MRILFAHEVDYREKPVFEMHEFPELLAAQGCEVAFLDFPEFTGGKGGFFKAPVPETIRRTWHLTEKKVLLYSPRVYLRGVMARAIAFALSWRLAANVIRDFKPDIVVSYSVATSGLQLRAAANRAGVPIIFRLIDVSSEIRTTRLRGLIRFIEGRLFSKGTSVSCNNESLADLYSSIGANVIDCTPPPVEVLSDAPSAEIVELRSQFRIPEENRVILFLGTFFEFAGLESAISIFAKEASSDAMFVLAGYGGIEDRLKGLVGGLNCSDRVIFAGRVHQHQLGALLALADVCINPFENRKVSTHALPHKVLQYMSAGKPVVTTKLDGLFRLISKAEGVTHVESSEQVMKVALTQLSWQEKELRRLGQLNRQFISKSLEPHAIAAKLLEVLRTVSK